MGILEAISQVYAPQCKVMKALQYRLALPYYMNNLWEQIYARGMKNLSMIIVVVARALFLHGLLPRHPLIFRGVIGGFIGGHHWARLAGYVHSPRL